MNVENKVFLKINDKRVKLLNFHSENTELIGDLLFKEYKIKSIESFDRFLKENKIEIFKTSTKKITETSQNGNKTNIELCNTVFDGNSVLMKNLLYSVKEYLKEFLLKYYQDLRLKEEQERKELEAKELKLKEEKIEKERIKKEKEEAELHRLAMIGRMCDKLFEVESFNQNYKDRYSGNATLKIKPFIEGSSFQIYNMYCGEKTPQVQRNNNEKARIQVGLSERGTIEFRW